jgi:hypothetical protein
MRRSRNNLISRVQRTLVSFTLIAPSAFLWRAKTI